MGIWGRLGGEAGLIPSLALLTPTGYESWLPTSQLCDFREVSITEELRLKET